MRPSPRSLALITTGLLLGVPAGLLIARMTGWGQGRESVTTAAVFQDVLSAIRSRSVSAALSRIRASPPPWSTSISIASRLLLPRR